MEGNNTSIAKGINCSSYLYHSEETSVSISPLQFILSADAKKSLKNSSIKHATQETRERRKSQVCRTYELKVDHSRLSSKKVKDLKRLFLEAKWFHNYLLSQDVWNQDYRVHRVQVKVGKIFEERDISILSSQMRQKIIDRTKDSIRSLSKLREKGVRVGKLKFKSHFNSIPLKQYGITYEINDKGVRIQNVGYLKVRGTEQIPSNSELASATLEKRDGGYFIRVTTFQSREEKHFPYTEIAIDFGIKNQLTLSNGIRIRESVPITDKIKRTHRELSRRKKHGKNWFKTLNRLNREYDHVSNQRKDSRNKIVSLLTTNYETIKMQDDNIAQWMKMWGRNIQSSSIGGIMSAFKQKAHTLIVVPRYVPTTQTRSRCGHRQEVELSDRVFMCTNCGISIDRDYNSSLCILNEDVPAERREYTPMDTKVSTYMIERLNDVPNVSASLVVEIGSFTALA